MIQLFKKIFQKKEHIYTRKEIGKMSCEKFRECEKEIMQQLKKGLIK